MKGAITRDSELSEAGEIAMNLWMKAKCPRSVKFWNAKMLCRAYGVDEEDVGYQMFDNIAEEIVKLSRDMPEQPQEARPANWGIF
jgi:hypothetical protein